MSLQVKKKKTKFFFYLNWPFLTCFNIFDKHEWTGDDDDNAEQMQKL